MKALYYIENSPLLKCIIYPRKQDFTLDESTLKFYSSVCSLAIIFSFKILFKKNNQNYY